MTAAAVSGAYSNADVAALMKKLFVQTVPHGHAAEHLAAGFGEQERVRDPTRRELIPGRMCVLRIDVLLPSRVLVPSEEELEIVRGEFGVSLTSHLLVTMAKRAESDAKVAHASLWLLRTSVR